MSFLKTPENISASSNVADSNGGMEEPLPSHIQKNWESCH